jgi:hypothetical protein
MAESYQLGLWARRSSGVMFDVMKIRYETVMSHSEIMLQGLPEGIHLVWRPNLTGTQRGFTKLA